MQTCQLDLAEASLVVTIEGTGDYVPCATEGLSREACPEDRFVSLLLLDARFKMIFEDLSGLDHLLVLAALELDLLRLIASLRQGLLNRSLLVDLRISAWIPDEVDVTFLVVLD